MIEVIDDFVTKSYHQELLSILDSPHMIWFFNKNISKQFPKEVKLDCYGCSNDLVREDQDIPPNPLSAICMPLLYQINDVLGTTKPLAARADMTLRQPEGIIHDPHVDYFFPHMSSVYYVNETDGPTVIYNERYDESTYPLDFSDLTVKTIVEPKPNRVVVFDGDLIHTGHSPKDHINRIIINSNYV